MKLPHLIIDLNNCDPEKLGDMDVVYETLDQLPDKINMQKVSPPILFTYEGGITGFVVLATSHIAIHTFPDDGYVFLDIFSCKDFDEKAANTFLMERFGSTDKILLTTIFRGKGFRGKGL